jgi:hypothetical protein
MGKDIIRYDLMVQEALKGVVRKILADAARDGLPGEHHFYVSFRTEAPGVRLSQRMREKYPDEMTVVLQHQFWDLTVTDQSFEVGLSFGGVGERLLVPFEAITGFFDPSVQFGLKFEPKDEGAESAEPSPAWARPAKPEEAKPPGQPSARRAAPADAPPADEAPPTAAKKPAVEPAIKPSGKPAPAKPAAVQETPAAEGGAQVVSLDAFRKKT